MSELAISEPPELSRAARIYFALQEQKRRMATRLFYEIYPDEDKEWAGPSILDGLMQHGQTIHARHRYAKHMEFFAAGADYRERCFMAANRIGKTFGGGGYETACHLTGQYPDWWIGKRFDQPISAWAAGDTYTTTRDVMQLTLLGQVDFINNRKRMDGRGVIPGELLGRLVWHKGVEDLVDKIQVRHVSGGWSLLGFKSYDQGRKMFQGTGRHVIWLDEEPPLDVYNECLVRTATVGGIVMLTFTPLTGMSEVVLSFMPQEMQPDIFDE